MADLLICNIIEKDNNGDLLWSWTFPSISQDKKDYLENKCNLQELKGFLYGRWNNTWFYINMIDCDSEKIKNVNQFGIIIWAKDFNPDKYYSLAFLFCNTYCETGDPTKVLQLYLTVFTEGINNNENGSFSFKELNELNNFRTCKIKEMIKMFGLEIILIYNALLLKRKLVVYHHSLTTLLDWLKSFPYLMRHRKYDNVLFPWFELTDEDIKQLMDCPNYIAGCCDNSIFSRPELYDVLVNLPAKEITVAQHAKDRLPITKAHKEIALFMEQLAKSEMNDESIIKGISEKTQEIISRLKSMSTLLDDGNYKLSVESLKKNDLSPAMENFLVQLASSENIQITGC